MVEKLGCKICGRYGHEASVCYELIGYLLKWGTRGYGRGNRGAQNDREGRGAGRNRGYGRESIAAAIHQEEGPTNVSAQLLHQVQVLERAREAVNELML